MKGSSRGSQNGKDRPKKRELPAKRGLPVLDLRGVKLPKEFSFYKGRSNDKLPIASIVYGVGAGGVFTMALHFLFVGRFLTFLLLLVLAGILLGFALYYIRSMEAMRPRK